MRTVPVIHCLRRHRFSRQTRLVDLQVCSLKELSVSRHLVASLYDDNIANHHFAAWYLHHLSFAYHLDRLLLTQLGEYVEFTSGITLKKETYGSGQDDGKDDTQRLYKVLLDKGQHQ